MMPYCQSEQSPKGSGSPSYLFDGHKYANY